MTIAHRLHSVNEYYFSTKLAEIAKLNAEGKDIINLGIGSPDLPPHPSVVQQLANAAAQPNTHQYQSYRGAPQLRKAVCEWYAKYYNTQLAPDTEVLPLIGSKEGIMHICMTYLNQGDKVWIPNPGYPTYAAAASLAGGTIVHYDLHPENNWQPKLQEMAAMADEVKLMFVNYPHMPTGAVADIAFYRSLVQFAHQYNILIINDNPYSFILNDSPLSLLSIEGAKECVIELNSLSKSHNMAGWRVGTMCSSATHINNVLRFKSNMDSGMFLPVQLAAATALQLPKEWYTELNKTYKHRQEKVMQILDELKCDYNKAQQGMFVWAKVPNQYADAYALSDQILYNNNVLLTPGGIFGSNGNNYIRVSLCQPIEVINEALARITNKV